MRMGWLCGLVVISVTTLCSGCASSPYVPESLEGTPTPELVRVLNHRANDMKLTKIDGRDTGLYSPLVLYVSPGPHTYAYKFPALSIRYKKRVASPEQLAKMRAEGWRIYGKDFSIVGGWLVVNARCSVPSKKHEQVFCAEAGQSLRFICKRHTEMTWDGAKHHLVDDLNVEGEVTE